MDADISRVVAMVWPHVHDISVSALAAAVVTLGVVIMLELRSVLKLRQVMDSNLARVFEQLDLLRFESQQLIEGQQLIEAHSQAGAASLARRTAPAPAQTQTQTQVQAGDVRAAALTVAPAPAARAAVTTAGTLAAAAPVTAGEARLLSSLAQARARRALSEPARA